MPSRIWYFVAIALLFLGVGGAVYLMMSRLEDIQSALKRVVVPGESVVALEEPGTYTLFHELSGTLDGVVYSASDISGLRVTLESVATGEAVELTRPAASTSYDMGGSSAVGIFAFTIDTPGEYRLGAVYDDGRSEPQAVLSMARGFVGKLVAAILSTVGLVIGSIALAIAIGVLTFLRRRKAMAGAGPTTAT
jgi:hypothetical protein